MNDDQLSLLARSNTLSYTQSTKARSHCCSVGEKLSPLADVRRARAFVRSFSLFSFWDCSFLAIHFSVTQPKSVCQPLLCCSAKVLSNCEQSSSSSTNHDLANCTYRYGREELNGFLITTQDFISRMEIKQPVIVKIMKSQRTGGWRNRKYLICFGLVSFFVLVAAVDVWDYY
jgi:hypothetical protein